MLWGLLAGLALVLVLFAALQTGPGLRLAASLASRAASAGSGLGVRIEAISGVLPFDFTVGRLGLSDSEGVWLAAKDLRLAWSPLELLRGRVVVREVSADILRLRRAPTLPPPPQEPVAMEWPPRFPSLPPILVDKLAVTRIILDEPVAGQAAVINLFGRLAESGQGAVGLTLAVHRLDAKALDLSVSGALNYAQWRLAAKASLYDAPGGLLSTALAGPDAGPLTLDLTGDGPLDAWKGHCDATLTGNPLLAADLGLAVPLAKAALASWSVSAALTPPAGLLPEAVASALGPRPTLDVAGRSGIVSNTLFLDRAAIRTAAGELTATAAMDQDQDTLAASATVSVADVSRLSPDLAGNLQAVVNASGRLMRPDIALTVAARDVRAATVSLGAADITAKAALAGDLGGVFPGASVAATGTLANLSGPEGATLLGQSLSLLVDAAMDAKGGITARQASLSGPGGAATLTGEMAPDGKTSGKASLRVADIAGAAALAGLALTGAVEVAADVDTDATGAGKAAVTAKLAGFSSRNPADAAGASLAALLGPEPTFSAKAAFSGGGVKLPDFSLRGRSVTLTASGDFNATPGTMTGSAKAEIPDLAVLGPALSQKLGGGLTLAADISGPAAAPVLTAKLAARKLAFGDTTLAEANLDLTAKDLAQKPAGNLSLAAKREGESARLETAFAMAGSKLSITGLRLAAPDAAFTGEAVVDTDSGKVSGKLSGSSTNLAGLGRFVGLPLAGSLKLNATAAPNRTGQGVTANVSADNLRAVDIAATSLSVSASLDDISGLPRGKATVTAKGLAAGGADLASLNLAATGDGRTLSATVDAQGTIPGDKALVLAAKASLAQANKGYTVTVSALSGTLDKRKFALTAPASAAFAAGTTRLDSLGLTFDTARITASASLGPKAVDAKVAVDHFPLPLLSLVGVTGVEGTAAVTATVSGAAANPRATAEVRVDGLNMVSEKGQGLPSMTARATATLEGGTLSAKASLAGTGKKESVTATATLPARFSLAPFAFALPPSGALNGQVKADTDLSDVAALLAQFNTRMTGRLTADLALSGTLAAPAVSGGLALAASRFENADSGMVLQNIAVRADAAGGVLTITKATGQDLKGGSFSITGKVGMSGAADAPVDLTIALKHLKAAGLDLASGVADGTITVTGTLSHMQAKGALEIGPAEVNLPKSLPPNVVVIPVNQINNPHAPPAPKKTPPPAAARRIDLDLSVTLGQAVYVRGMGVESRWAGKITITGTAAAPKIVGKYYVEKGMVELFGSTLDITKGEVLFSGESPPNPRIDILATTTSDDVTAGVSLTGDADNPSIELTSQPPLPHDEVLSRILFGKSASNLTPLQAAQLAQAAASLYAGGSPTSILARTRRILGLDQLTLVSGKGGLSSTVIRASKEIVKGVTVNVEQGVGAQSGAVSVEVQVTPNITVDSRVGADNKQGVGVNWKWDY